ncbi:embryo-specific protein ATS3A-like isoform X2 [Cryptomeria japonica]|uniref:embryo-specific protein ATS3A isoform X2 n=1 Tax=Cryptomeria japonica TaxID=3369 RepID=UPI0027D9E1B4|nr:embryo-specific protein ATS3A isoform X2 [Cryptomeria japonica]XP_059077248.1 embryo-specific protein ATS3A-like isoform X2 [Cryptomeria japonica]
MAWRLQILGFLLINLALLACICATAQEENCSYTLEVETSCYPLSGTDERVLVRFGDKSFYEKNKTEGECPYILEVKTSKRTLVYYDPGTKDHVRVRFGDKSQSEVMDRHLSEPFEGNNQQPFEADNTAKFNISGTCVESDVCYLYFKVEGTDKWKPNHAVVYSGEMNSTFYFKDRYMPENSWDGHDFWEEREQLASFAVEDSMYQKTQNTNKKPCKRPGGKSGKKCT